LSMEDRYIYESIYTLEQYPALFVPILFELGMALKKAMELQEIIGNASYWHDRSHWDMPSISPHAQNQRFHNWVILIGLCRDVWQAAWQHDKKMAIAVLETWKVIRFPVFRRLLFHAYTVGDVVMPSQMLDELLADDNWWLWVVDVGREKYRLLHTIWPVLDSCDSERLIDVVMAGPPRKMFQDDLSDSEWRDCRSRAIWKLLAMLASFGRPLPLAAQKIFEQISAEYPMWRLRGDDQDEFSHWMYETTWGPNSDISLDNLISLQPDELVKKLLENNPEKHEGRISVFRTLCKENSSKAYNILEWLTNNNLWHDELWHAALVGLADGKDTQFLPVAKWLSSAPAELLKNEAWSIAWWVKATSDRYEPDSEEEHFFWLIFNALLENAPQNDFSRDDDVLSSAINDPFGMITEALISRFGCRKIDRNKGIPTGPLMKSVSQVMDGNGAGFILARVILASRLHYFHAIAPEWARKNIIQKMAWGESNEASYLWQGYLGGARISADLLLDLKVYFLQTISHIEELYSSSRERFFQLIAIILLQSTDAFSKIEKTELLRKVGHEGRREIVSVFLQSFQGNGKKEKNELFWSNHLKPLFKWVWPKDATSIDEITSQYLTLLAVKTGGKFPEAIDIFQQIIGPFSELRSFITALNNSSLPQNYPKEVIRLFEMVFTEQYQYPTENFRKVLNRIIEANPALAKNETYRRIDYFLQGKNL